MNKKLDVGNVLQRTVQVYRDQFGLLVPAALVLFVPVAIVNGLVLDKGGVLGGLAAAAIGVVATYWFQGMVVEAVRDILDGRRDYTVGSLFKSVTPVIGALIGAGILAGIATGIGFILLIVPGLFLLTIWAVLAPVIVVERPGIIPAFGRSRELVRGNGWPVFGVILVIFLATVVLGIVLQGIVSAISDGFVARVLADLIVRVLIAPLSAIAAAVLYFELKGTGGGGAPLEDTQQQPVPGPGPEAMPRTAAPAKAGPAPEAPGPGGPTQADPVQPGTPPPPERP